MNTMTINPNVGLYGQCPDELKIADFVARNFILDRAGDSAGRVASDCWWAWLGDLGIDLADDQVQRTLLALHRDGLICMKRADLVSGPEEQAYLAISKLTNAAGGEFNLVCAVAPSKRYW